jgi:hypothetical protein
MNGFTALTRKSSIKREIKALIYTWMEDADLEVWIRYFIVFVVGYFCGGAVYSLITN